jgi:bifunctional DNA-binding transcriptional regulator/antitoxin component of YhaV-PrlF toxin-antitoxin module
LVRVRVVPRHAYYLRKGDGTWKGHYMFYRLQVEFPAEFAERILDFAGVEVGFERRGDEIIIRPKDPENLRRELLNLPPSRVQEALKMLLQAKKPKGKTPATTPS